ncbi:hypothetical protein HPG69_018288, partial [Diceros bicornis minor]
MSDQYVWLKGIPLPALTFIPEALREEWETFVFKDEDVVILTYPKSVDEWSAFYMPDNGQCSGGIELWPDAIYIQRKGFSQALTQKDECPERVIYLIRNPRDILVAGYFFYRISNFIKKPELLEEYFEWFIQGN